MTRIAGSSGRPAGIAPRCRPWLGFVCTVGVAVSTAACQARPDASDAGGFAGYSYADVVARVAPAVVTIGQLGVIIDIITAFNGAAVDDSNSLRIQVAGAQPGAAVSLTYWRDGREQQARVTLAELPPPQTRT
jgi:S1-C subfamily serine protease